MKPESSDKRLVTSGLPRTVPRLLFTVPRLLLTALYCSLLLLTSLPARAQGEFKLTGVTIVGARRFDQEAIVKATGLKLGGSLSLEGLKEAADRLASLGAFAQVGYRYQTRGDQMTAVFTVQDAPRFYPCAFSNFVWFTRQDLLDGLRARVPLFDGAVPPGGKMLELVSAELRARLEARGLHAEVEASPVGEMGGPVRAMDFHVTGLPIPIRKVEFSGVEKIKPELLEKAAQPLVGENYDAAFVRGFAVETLAGVYHERGYLRAAFGGPVPRLLADDPTPNAVAVSFAVTEGETYTLKDITWAGETAIPYEKLAKTLHARPGQIVNALELEQDVLALPMLFHPKGYLMADARAVPSLDDAAHTASYRIEIVNGNDLYRLGKFEVAGVDPGLASQLEALCRLRPGDPYDPGFWSDFVRAAMPKLPKSPTGWKLDQRQTIHPDTKTVDLVVTPIPAAR